MLRNLGIISKKNEQGLASIVVVGVLIVLLTVISLGFARIMDRTVKTVLNDQTSAAASYAAQSGINDLATYIRTNPGVNATECKHLIGTSGTPGPFYTSSNLSGDRNSEYTCILLDQRPDTVAYQKIETLKSKVIKLTTEAATGSVDRLLFSWQSSSGETPRKNITPAPVSARLPDVTSWNQSDYIPMVRLTLYPVKTSASVSTVQQESRTIFLYPNPHTISNEAIDFSSIGEGSIQSVGCRGPDKDAPGFVGQALLDCNVAINGLASIPDIDYFYIRIVPIYNSIDFEVKARDIDDRKIRFTGVQAVLDVTAKVGPASKRLQARVDIGGNTGDVSNPIEPSPNVSPEDAAIPDFSLRTANAICKRTLFHDTPYAYVTFEGNPTSCQAGGLVDIPNAAITYFRINGIDDTTPTPAPYTGVSYIAAGGTANLTWQTTDAIACEGSRGMGAWPGSKVPPIMTWAGSVGTGAQSIGGITNVTYFDLRCSGPDSTTSTRTVTAWPPPTADVSGPGSIRAGDDYTITWSSTNATRCEKSGTWGVGPVDVSGSDPENWPLADASSTRTYTITCYDPSGRSATDTHTVSPSVPPGSTTTPVSAPECDANTVVTANSDGTVSFSWWGDCPRRDPDAGTYDIYSRTDSDPSVNASSVYRNGGPFLTGVRYGSEFCLGIKVRFGGWGELIPSGARENCATPYHARVRINYFYADVWDQGPSQCSNAVIPIAYRNTWRCRNDVNTVNIMPGCANGIHRFTACDSGIYWWTTLEDGRTAGINCRHKSNYGYFGGSFGGGFQDSGPWGWVDGGGPYPFWLECTGPTPVAGGGPNYDDYCYSGGRCD